MNARLCLFGVWCAVFAALAGGYWAMSPHPSLLFRLPDPLLSKVDTCWVGNESDGQGRVGFEALNHTPYRLRQLRVEVQVDDSIVRRAWVKGLSTAPGCSETCQAPVGINWFLKGHQIRVIPLEVWGTMPEAGGR